MLVRVDPEKDAVTMLSFPRDLVVSHPGCEGHPPWVGRINEAYAYCGPRGTLTTVKELTGIPINYMITVNFQAFEDRRPARRRLPRRRPAILQRRPRRRVPDARPEAGLPASERRGCARLRPSSPHRLRPLPGRAPAGVREGAQAAGLERLGRLRAPGVVKAITENIEVAKGGGKPISSGEVLGYANALYGLPAGNFQQVSLEGVSGYFELGVREAFRRRSAGS